MIRTVHQDNAPTPAQEDWINVGRHDDSEFPDYLELKSLCIYTHRLDGYSLVVWDALNDVLQFQMDLSGR
ncbi:hypothetical protein RvY_12391 [Ramazzottius varieornatus]|uniref:Uncharacterized protein n=1 Tax=Ramazzottius varieornatus TaxID=947166 RepID=A0A1D1VLD2_RAMVA|nr:hypothetical protein RvY_12391 [Ramazzottius varieornatus]